MSELPNNFYAPPLDRNLEYQARELGLVLPSVRIANDLLHSADNGRPKVKINGEALLFGAQDIGLKNPVTMLVNENSESDAHEPAKAIHVSDSLCMLSLRPTSGVKEDLSRKINSAFWLGVLVTDIFAKGEALSYDNEQKYRLFGATGLAITGAVVACYDVGEVMTRHQPSSLAHIATIAGLGILTAAELGGAFVVYGLGAMKPAAYIERKQLKRAKELGENNPVIKYIPFERHLRVVK